MDKLENALDDWLAGHRKKAADIYNEFKDVDWGEWEPLFGGEVVRVEIPWDGGRAKAHFDAQLGKGEEQYTAVISFMQVWYGDNFCLVYTGVRRNSRGTTTLEHKPDADPHKPNAAPHKSNTDPHKQVRSFVDLMLGCRVLGLI